jgi:uncharacterized glyoxalase superfamily protein PhnB
MSNVVKEAKTHMFKKVATLNHYIHADDAKDWIARFEEQAENIVNGQFEGQGSLLPFSETFNPETIRQIINKPHIKGFRIYLGMDSENKVRMILAGVNEQGHDLTTYNKNAFLNAAEDNDIQGSKLAAEDLAENGQRKP